MRLRTDQRQWLIYQRGPVEATVRALEAMALGMAGRSLAHHSNVAVRAVGNVMVRLAEARVRAGLGLVKGEESSDERRAAMEHAVAVSNWAAAGGPEPSLALDELHAAVFFLDSRLQSAGLSGPGWVRDLGRGD